MASIQRVLIFLVLLYLVWRVLGIRGRKLSRELRESGIGREPRSRPVDPSQPLVRCAGCGTFFPAERIQRDRDGLGYCSDDCRQRLAASGEHAAS